MSKSQLMIVKMINGSNVLAEISYDEENYTYEMSGALLIEMTNSPTGEITSSMPYLPGMIAESSIIIPSSSVIALSHVEPFFARFYGMSILKFYMQTLMRRRSFEGSDELDSRDISMLELRKEELALKYGFEHEHNSNNITENRILH